MAVYAFAFQIYCDFAGYSDIARGLARVMGFDLMLNFRLPYIATNPRDFWRRWHISLSTWLRDYLYIPLGGGRGPLWLTCRNLAVTMLLGGLWHGAAWTFVVWGAYQGVLLIGYRWLEPVLARVPVPSGRPVRWLWQGVRMVIFFHLVCLGWLIFRAHSLEQAGALLRAVLTLGEDGWGEAGFLAAKGAFFLWILWGVQAVQALWDDLDRVRRWGAGPRIALYSLCTLLIIIFGVTGGQQFIYFQF